ncbi:MAG: lamin tail domain-containing protein [Acidobacteriota bacterium]
MGRRKLILFVCVSIIASFTLTPRLTKSTAITIVRPQAATLIINEYLADPPPAPDGDANGDGMRSPSQDEFVELVNTGSVPLDISGFTVSDSEMGPVRFTFPEGTIIPVGEATVVFGGGTPTGDFGNAAINKLVFKAPLSLDNTSGKIIVRDSMGDEVVSHDYPPPASNVKESLTRSPDITGSMFIKHSLADGSGGSFFSPGTKTDGSPFTIGPRISEIDPDRVPLDSPPFDLTIRGSGFEADSTVLIDQLTLPAQLAAGDLVVSVPASVTAIAGAHSVEVRNAGGNRSNKVTLVIVPPPPSLNLVLPRQIIAGGPSLTMFLVGANFDPASTVLIDDAAITPQFLNIRELRITVTAAMIAAPGSRRVRVRNGDGLISNETTFDVVLPLARITGLAPGHVIAGNPSFALDVTGVNFRNGSAVFFDQTLVATQFISSTRLRAEIPASLVAAPGLRSVAVQNNDGALSNDAVFAVLPDAPMISQMQPRSVIEGSGDTAIAITGMKFQRGAMARVIENSRVGMRLQTAFISAERLEAMLPAAFVRAPGRVSLIVENPDFGISNAAALDVLIKDPLVINEYLADPPEGAAGDANSDGVRSSSQDEFIEIVNRTSAPIDISGYKLFDSDAVRHVFANGTVIPPKEAAVVFGGGAPAGRFGNAAENRLVFTASTGGLSLANTGDAIRLENDRGQVIQGIRFGAFEGGADQSINRDPDIDGAMFALHTRVAPNRLFSPGAKAAGESFTIKPSISSLMPSNVRVASPAFTLKVTGENFLPRAVVLFGQTELATSRRSASELEAEVIATLIGEGGAVEVRVRNPEGEISASAQFLITDDSPVIASITPDRTGTGAENFEITIAGRRFQRGAQAMIETELIETRFISSAEIRARVPDRFFTRAADIEIRVRNADGNQSNGARLAVENGPLITRLSRTKIKAGRGDAEITIGGVVFKQGVRLLVDGVAVESRFISETEFSARIPGSMTAAPARLTIQALNPDGGRSNRAVIRVVE